MKKLTLAIAVASAALLAATAEAAPVTGGTSVAQGQAASEAQKIWYHRRWHRRWGYRGWYGHSRYWSHRRHGSWGW